MSYPIWPGVTEIIDNGFGKTRAGNTINGVIPHHVAGLNGRDYVAKWNTRNSHPSYHIDRLGGAASIVHPDRRPTSTGNNIDQQAITFEIDNIATGGNWPVAMEALETVAQVTAFYYRLSPRFGNGIALNKKGIAQPEFFVGWHSQYSSTACPGPFTLDHLDWVAGRALELAGEAPAPIPTPTPEPGVKIRMTYCRRWVPVRGDGINYSEPTGELANRILRGMVNYGLDPRWNSLSDGRIGKNTRKAIQRCLKAHGYYGGVIDGWLGWNNLTGIQKFARDRGGYTNVIDAKLFSESWSGFATALGQ